MEGGDERVEGGVSGRGCGCGWWEGRRRGR